MRIDAAVPNLVSAATSQTSAACFFSTTSSSSVRDRIESPTEPGARRATARRYSPCASRSTMTPSSGCSASNALSRIISSSSSSATERDSAWWTALSSSSRAARRRSSSTSVVTTAPETDSRSSASALL